MIRIITVINFFDESFIFLIMHMQVFTNWNVLQVHPAFIFTFSMELSISQLELKENDLDG